MGFQRHPRTWRPGLIRMAAAVVATVVVSMVTVPLSGSAASASTAATFPGTPLWVYGHSYTVSPGLTNTPGREWMPRLAADLGLPAWRTFGVKSSRLIDTFGDLSRQAGRTPVANSAWDPRRRGVVVLQSEFNDMVNRPGPGVLRVGPLTAKAVANYGQTLQATLALLASSTRADWSAARSSSGWAGSIGPAYLGGSLVYTIKPGAYREMTVDVGPAGTVWVVTWEVASSNRNPYNGVTAISVDGRLRATLPARTAAWESIWSDRGGGYQHAVGPRATKVSGLIPGRHTIRVAKADRGPGAVVLDQLLVQSAAPLPVLVVRDPLASTSGHWVTQPSNRATFAANLPPLHAQIDAVARQFPNVAVATFGGLGREQYGGDGLHMSDLGMGYEARLLAQTFRTQVARYDVPAMYR